MSPQTLLSQEEIEALLELVQSDRPSAAAAAGDAPHRGVIEGEGDEAVTLRDFSKPESLPRSEFEFLWSEATDAASRVRDALSRWLRMEAHVECVGIEPAQFQVFTASLPSPCAVYPLRCGTGSAFFAALQIDSSLALACIDRTLGGTGRARFASRALTSVERLVCDRLANTILGSLSDGLVDAFPMERTFFGALATSPRQARCLEPDAPVLVATYSIGGELAETEVRLVVPTAAYPKRTAKVSAARPASTPPALPSVAVELSVRLGNATLSLQDLLALEPGDVVALDARTDAPSHLEVEGLDVATANVGTFRDHFAVSIDRVLRTLGPAAKPK